MPACRSSHTIRATAPTPRDCGGCCAGWAISEVAVLNGGFAAWQRAGLPLSTATSTPRPRPQVRAAPVDGAFVTTAELERLVADGALASGEQVLVDARGADRFAGQNETIDPVAGHIPGARNHPFAATSTRTAAFWRRGAAPALAADIGADAAGPGDRHVRLGRDGLSQPARARGRGPRRRAAVCGLME